MSRSNGLASEHLTLAAPRETKGLRSRLLFVASNALYYFFARHLPYSVRPYAFGAKRIRRAVTRHMFASCGANVNVEHGALINGGDQIHIGENSGIGYDAYISGPLIIGSNVIMGSNCTFLSINRITDRVDTTIKGQGFQPARPPVIEDGVWIGANVTVLPGRRIGHDSIVAAGAVVTRDVEPFTVVGGNPARLIKDRRAVAAAAPRAA